MPRKPAPPLLPSNEDRMHRALVILKQYRDLYDKGEHAHGETVFVDLLADLMHQAGEDWAQYEGTARMHYEAEKNGED